MAEGVSLKDGKQSCVVGTERAKRGRGVMNQVGMGITLSLQAAPHMWDWPRSERKSRDDALLIFAVILFKSKSKP